MIHHKLLDCRFLVTSCIICAEEGRLTTMITLESRLDLSKIYVYKCDVVMNFSPLSPSSLLNPFPCRPKFKISPLSIKSPTYIKLQRLPKIFYIFSDIGSEKYEVKGTKSYYIYIPVTCFWKAPPPPHNSLSLKPLLWIDPN